MSMRKSLTVLVLVLFALFTTALWSQAAGVSSGEVTLKVTVAAPENNKDTKVWIPYPTSDMDQEIEDVRIDGNFTYSGIYREPETGNLALYAEWKKPVRERYITLRFKATAAERIKKDFPDNLPQEIPVEVLPYLKATEFLPTDGKVKDAAVEATKGKKTILEKARAVYDWVVDNTFRDPEVQGCGVGDVEVTLAKKGGKCADISSVFVAVARAAGVPAREVFGLRLGRPGQTDITKGHHCWAEFYLPGYGWVPVDPADVRKMMLVKDLDLDAAKEYREYFFGAVDQYRIVLARGGRGYYLRPRQKAGPLNYFMYPYAEVDGKALEWLAAQKDLKYKITFRELEPNQRFSSIR